MLAVLPLVLSFVATASHGMMQTAVCRSIVSMSAEPAVNTPTKLLAALVQASDQPELVHDLLHDATPMLLHPHRRQASRPRASIRCMLAVENARLDRVAASYSGEHSAQAEVALRQMREHVLSELGFM
jgi:hypothetical protein